MPSHTTYVTRAIYKTTEQERRKVQEETEYNVFLFPASMLVADYVSDSGYTAMSDTQWAALMRGDEAYGRNHGYYCLLESMRDVFERKNCDKRYLARSMVAGDTLRELLEFGIKDISGGLINGGKSQLTRPNAFIVPQGRCAENLLFTAMRGACKPGMAVISNGFFDTTEANTAANGFEPVNCFDPAFNEAFSVDDLWTKNNFRGNLDVRRCAEEIAKRGADNVAMILLTITNNTGAGQPVSMANIKATAELARQHGIPLFFDAARFAENAYFIREFEAGYAQTAVGDIVQEMFAHADGFTISLKKDGLCNMGGFLCFRDKGVFHARYSTAGDIGVRIKEKQITTYGNDSYGGLSGRDIMAAAQGLYEVIQEPYLKHRIEQVRYFGEQLARRNVPVYLPTGGHAIFLDMTKFFEGTDFQIDDFGGVGFCIEMVARYAIRPCELGPFAFEWDKKNAEQRQSIHNLVRFAVPRNMFNKEHIDYTVAAIAECHRHRHMIPKVRLARGKELRLRHFQTGLQPVYQ